MKHFHSFRGLAAVTGFFVVCISAGAQQLKVASVEMSRIFDEYYKTKSAKASLDDRTAAFQKELKQKMDALTKLSDEGKKLQEEADSPTLTEEKRAEKRKLLDSKRSEFHYAKQDLDLFNSTRGQEINDEFTRKKRDIVTEIKKAIDERAKRDGYTMVVDKSGAFVNGVSPFIFIQDSIDISNDIVKTLNAGAPAGSAPKDPKPKDSKSMDPKK